MPITYFLCSIQQYIVYAIKNFEFFDYLKNFVDFI